MSHILLIDDDELICQMFSLALRRAGYRVSVAHDGRKGLAVHKVTPADLVITDLIMPGMEGIEAIIEFRRRFPAVKIVAMSGGVSRSGEYLRMAEKFGAIRTLAKPFGPDDLVGVVTEMLGEPGEAGPADQAV